MLALTQSSPALGRNTPGITIAPTYFHVPYIVTSACYELGRHMPTSRIEHISDSVHAPPIITLT